MWTGLNKINLMIGGSVIEKNVPRWRLERIAEELGGEIHYQEVLDAQGRKTKKIIISYREYE